MKPDVLRSYVEIVKQTSEYLRSRDEHEFVTGGTSLGFFKMAPDGLPIKTTCDMICPCEPKGGIKIPPKGERMQLKLVSQSRYDEWRKNCWEHFHVVAKAMNPSQEMVPASQGNFGAYESDPEHLYGVVNR